MLLKFGNFFLWQNLTTKSKMYQAMPKNDLKLTKDVKELSTAVT